MKSQFLRFQPYTEQGRDKSPILGDSPRRSTESNTQLPKPRLSERAKYTLQMEANLELASPVAQPTQQRITDPLGGLINQYSKGEEDILSIQAQLEKIPFFQSLEEQLTLLNDKEAYYSLLRTLKYQQIDSGTIIFKEKGVSDGNVYIVHGGSVGIFTRSLDKYRLYNPKSSILDKDSAKDFNIHFPDEDDFGEKSELNFDDFSNDFDGSLLLDSCNRVETEENALRKSRQNRSRAHSKSSHKQCRTEASPKASSRERSSTAKKITTFYDDISDASPKSSNLLSSNVNLYDCKGPGSQFMITSARQRSSSYATINRLPIPRQGINSAKKSNAQSKYGKFIEVIKSSNYFGERALQTIQKRYMTAMTLEDSRLIVLNNEDLAIAKKLLEKKRDSLIQFLSCQFPFFATIPPDMALSHITSTITEKTLSIKNLVTGEGKKDEYFYLIYEGECELYRTVTIEENDPFHPLTQVKKHMIKQMNNKEQVKICNLQRGTFIGEEVIYSKEGKYYFTAKVFSSEAKLLAFHKTKFMMKFSKEMILELKRLHEHKMRNYTSLFAQTLAVKGLALDEERFLEKNQVAVIQMKEVASLTTSNNTNRQNFIKSLSSTSYNFQKIDMATTSSIKVFKRQFENPTKPSTDASRSSKNNSHSESGIVAKDKTQMYFQEVNFGDRQPLGQIKDHQNSNHHKALSQIEIKDFTHSQTTVSSPTNNHSKTINLANIKTALQDIPTFITPVMSPVAKSTNDIEEKPLTRDENRPLYARKTRYNTENTKSPRNLKFSFDEKRDKIQEAKERLRLDKLNEKKSQPIFKSGLDQVFMKLLESKVKDERSNNEKVLQAYLDLNSQATFRPVLEIHALKSTKKDTGAPTFNIHTVMKRSNKINNPFMKSNRTDVLKANNENILLSDTLTATKKPMSATFYKTSSKTSRKYSASDLGEQIAKTFDRAPSRG